MIGRGFDDDGRPIAVTFDSRNEDGERAEITLSQKTEIVGQLLEEVFSRGRSSAAFSRFCAVGVITKRLTTAEAAKMAGVSQRAMQQTVAGIRSRLLSVKP